jgi:hypothetical protein
MKSEDVKNYNGRLHKTIKKEEGEKLNIKKMFRRIINIAKFTNVRTSIVYQCIVNNLGFVTNC